MIHFAADLRRLREKAGKPSYRELARGAHYSSTTLSDAAGGRRLPTLAVVRAYVRACDGNVPEWEERWRQLSVGQELSARNDRGALSPYLGPEALRAEHADQFFGREALLLEVLDQLARDRFVAVVGPSGIGKSSLLHAGLAARLRCAGLNGCPVPAVEVMTPGPHPLEQFTAHLARHRCTTDLVVVIDQFEEVFTLCRDHDERDAFLTAVTGAQDVGPRIAIGLRSDFLASCTGRPGPAARITGAQVAVGALSPDEVRQVVLGPAERAGYTVEASLVAAVVAEASGRAGALPLVSDALLQTWRQRTGGTLTLDGYRAAGGVGETLAHRAEARYTSMSAERRRVARGLFLRLITLGPGNQDAPRRVSRDELGTEDPQTRAVLEALVAARLVTIDEAAVELAHETLITTWPRLRTWLARDREALHVHRELTGAAHSWDVLSRDPGALLRGTQLTITRAWAQRDGHDGDLSPTERAFLQASIEAETREQAAAARHGRQLRLLAAGLAALLVVLIGITFLAAGRWRAAATGEPTVSRHLPPQVRALAGCRPVFTGLSGGCPALSGL